MGWCEGRVRKGAPAGWFRGNAMDFTPGYAALGDESSKALVTGVQDAHGFDPVVFTVLLGGRRDGAVPDGTERTFAAGG